MVLLPISFYRCSTLVYKNSQFLFIGSISLYQNISESFCDLLIFAHEVFENIYLHYQMYGDFLIYILVTSNLITFCILYVCGFFFSFLRTDTWPVYISVLHILEMNVWSLTVVHNSIFHFTSHFFIPNIFCYQ